MKIGAFQSETQRPRTSVCQTAAGSFVEIRVFSAMVVQLARAVFGAGIVSRPAAVFTATLSGRDVVVRWLWQAG